VKAGTKDSDAARPADKPAGDAATRKADEPKTPQETAEGPVFKVQFMTADRKLPANSSHFKGLKDVGMYHEGALWKYTVGSSTDYNAVLRLRRQVAEKFPQAFVIAFKNGEKVNTAEAIREFKSRKTAK
jgi:N-acetylmuramoyl-L-alanine amidase